jgi:hypothetical protein
MSTRLQKREIKLRERCQTLANIVREVSKIYNQDQSSENQKHFIETMIGAALWYLPVVDECWSGKISVEAIQSFHPDSNKQPKLTSDHEYPRKIAAADLLTRDFDASDDLAENLYLLYKSKYGRINYITPRENKALTQYQRKGVFENPSVSYQKVGIKLISITKAELLKIKSRDRETIELLLKRAI